MKRRIFFPIGEFAKIVGVNKRTLHYYDAQGIFRPDHVAPNGYRSYSFRQFYPFYRLRMMRSMGLELAEIRDYMEHRSPERLDQLLGRQQEWLKRELDGMKRSLRIVENQRRLLSLSRTIVCGRVAEKELPAARLILSRSARKQAAGEDWPTVEQIAAEHERYAAEQQISAGLGVGAMIAAEDFLQPGREGIISHFFTVVDPPWRGVRRAYRHIRPAGRYLVTCFRGDYDDTAEAYALLRDYIRAHGCQVGDFSYEESILEDMSTADPDGFITRIAVPLREPAAELR